MYTKNSCNFFSKCDHVIENIFKYTCDDQFFFFFFFFFFFVFIFFTNVKNKYEKGTIFITSLYLEEKKIVDFKKNSKSFLDHF
jgi:hypothetical protein